jgi:hypothetical protein
MHVECTAVNQYSLLFTIFWCFCEQEMINVVVPLQGANSSSDDSGGTFSQVVTHLQVKQDWIAFKFLPGKRLSRVKTTMDGT